MKHATLAYLISLLIPTFSLASPELEFNDSGFDTVLQKVSQGTATLEEVQSEITQRYTMASTEDLFKCGYIHALSLDEAQQREPQPWNDLTFLTLILKQNLRYPQGHEQSGFVFDEGIWDKIQAYFITS